MLPLSSRVFEIVRSSMLTEIPKEQIVEKCEVCLSPLTGPTLELGSHPLCDDMNLIGDMVKNFKYHQKIRLCVNCFTAHQLHPVSKQQLFTPAYRYRARLTKDVLLGMQDLVASTTSKLEGIENPLILDVGCNDGSLLGIFKYQTTCRTIGVDPTDAIDDAVGKIDFPIRAYFDSKVATEIVTKYGKPDLITFTNVFAHIEDLPALLSALRILLKDSTVLVIENHYLGSVLGKSQFDTFYHEHPRTYSAKSFAFIAESLELQVSKLEFPKRYGGNIRVTLSSQPPAGVSIQNELMESESIFVEQFVQMQVTYDEWRESSIKTLNKILGDGVIFGKSLPGRAVMLISSLGISESEMPKLFEQPTSPKIGHYVPGTHIEICSDAEIMQYKPKRIIVWAWHIAEEVTNYLSEIGFRGEIWVPLPTFALYKVL
jgi:SAM-dependent methyltransferase